MELPRVVIAGAGIAGLEALLAVQRYAQDRVRIELLAPASRFAYRPLSVAEPFGSLGGPMRFDVARIAADRGVRVHADGLAGVAPGGHRAVTRGGERLPYDMLLVAVGARWCEAVPGATLFRGAEDVERLSGVVDRLRDGTLRRLAFVVPPEASWPLPLYELALQVGTALGDGGGRAELSLVTTESAPLAMFGATPSRIVGALLAERGVAFRSVRRIDEVSDGRVWCGPDGAVHVDRAIALPGLSGPQLRGLPADPLGFVRVDGHGRVPGARDVWAAGDAAAAAPKQGGLAAQQADTAARAIAARAGVPVTTPRSRPVLRAALLTGTGTLYLRRAAGEPGEASEEPLWWPPTKVVAPHLSHFLASHLELATSRGAAPS
jgi:sulfide:quinone oxidoreductase